MPGIDYTHQHLSTSIMKVGEEHTPIDPSGGGAIAVTGSESGSVSDVTAVQAAGTVAEGDPGQAVITPPNNLLLGDPSPMDPNGQFNSAITVNDGSGNGAYAQLLGAGAEIAGGGGYLQLQSARGTLAAPEAVVDGDTVGQVGFIGSQGADASAYAGLIWVQVDGIPAGFDVPGKMTLAVKKLGGGYGGNVVLTAAGHVIPSLPTSDPAVAGALWNDTGTVKVSAG